MPSSSSPPPPPKQSRLIDATPFPFAWAVLMASLVTMVATIPGQTVGVSVFLDAIIDDLGVTRSTVSLLYTVGTLAGSLALPFVGRFIDGRGPRLAVGLIASAFAGACLYMSFVEGLWMLAIGFVLIRMLGQGSLSLVSQHVLNLWFVQRRGMAVGLVMIGMAVATALAPQGLESLVGAVGWRSGYAWLAAIVALVAVPVGVTFFRDRPEAYGHRPDGHRRSTVEERPLREATMSLAQARRTAAFWLVVSGDAAVSALGTGLIFHHFDILAQGGIDRMAAAAVFVPIGLVTAVGTFGSGVMLDRFPPRFTLSLCLAFLVAALLMAGNVPPGLAWLYGTLLGLAQGMKNSVSGAIYATYFGRRHLGSVKGFATTLTTAGTAIGPLLFSVGYDLAGSYVPVLWLSALWPAVGALAALRLRPPSAPSQS